MNPKLFKYNLLLKATNVEHNSIGIRYKAIGHLYIDTRFGYKGLRLRINLVFGTKLEN